MPSSITFGRGFSANEVALRGAERRAVASLLGVVLQCDALEKEVF